MLLLAIHKHSQGAPNHNGVQPTLRSIILSSNQPGNRLQLLRNHSKHHLKEAYLKLNVGCAFVNGTHFAISIKFFCGELFGEPYATQPLNAH